MSGNARAPHGSCSDPRACRTGRFSWVKPSSDQTSDRKQDVC